MKYKIEDNIPCPIRSGVKSELSNAFLTLKKGQSFFCGDGTRAKLSSRSSYLGKKLAAKFSVVSEGDGFRVFRTM
jgi:hypothetical protein